MNPMVTPLLWVAGLVSLAAATTAALTLRAIRRQERVTERLRDLRRGERESARLLAFREHDGLPGTRSGAFRLLWLIAAIGNTLARSGALSDATLVRLQQTLQAAGARAPDALGIFVGSKLLLLTTLPAAAWFGLRGLTLSMPMHNAAIAGAAVAGLLLPDYYLRSRRAAVIKQLRAGLPDALDMMVICSEAGLALEHALARVALEIAPAHPAVAGELGQTASELRVAADRRTALLNMGARTGLESLTRLGTTLVQTLRYGTPLSQTLRTLSTEMRGEMLVQFEERAARLPVLLTLPMIVFILPTVFVIVGGPAMLSVVAAVSH